MKPHYLLLFCLPLKHLSLTSPFGNRIHPLTRRYQFHQGIDLRSRRDTVYNILAGKACIGYDQFLGVYIKVSDDDMEITYGHLSQVLAGEQQVPAGTPIAITGATGRVTGEHLHLSIKYQEKPLDPLKFMYQLIQYHE